MSDMNSEDLKAYYESAESWSDDRQRASNRSRRLGWTVAAIAGSIALIEAFALLALVPLRRDIPYTLLVDRQTGFVQALRPLQEERITADSALTRSFLAQYVIARETFDADTLPEQYRKVGLWSGDSARERYLAEMRSSNPSSPIATLPPGATIDVTIQSISSLSSDSAMVRFTTVRSDRQAGGQLTQHWAAVIRYRYVDAAMSAEDRLANPLGFQVIRYRKDPETLPREAAAEASDRKTGSVVNALDSGQ